MVLMSGILILISAKMCASFIRMLAGLLKIFWEEMWIYVIHFSIAITEVLRQCSHYVHIELIRLREGYLYQFTKSGLL